MFKGMRRYLIASAAVLVSVCLGVALFLSQPFDSQALGADDSSSMEISEDATSALDTAASFGITDFARANKGTNKLYSGKYYGYRYPMATQNALTAVITSANEVIVYIPQSTLDTLGASIDDPSFTSTVESTLVSIDAAAANGGNKLETIHPSFTFTSQDSLVRGSYTYAFGVEVEEGVYYATVTDAQSQDGSGGALYAESGVLKPADEMTVSSTPTGLAALGRFFETLDWRPLWVSLKTASVAMIVVFLLGLFAAWRTIKAPNRWKGVLDTVFTIPMVLPPTVCGFLLLMLFGNSTDVGRWLISMGIDLVFTWPAAVIACIVVAFPLMYRTTRGAFESLDGAMLDAARTLGWSEWRIFGRLMMPLAWPSIAAGAVLAFARAMGEFGATLFFAGNYAGVTQTIPIAIYFDWMAGDTAAAIFWVIVVILLSFLVILFINVYSAHTQKWKGDDDEPVR